MRKLVASFLVSASVVGCGSAANFNKIWGNDDDAADVKYARAKSAYDQGDFQTAQDLLEALVARNQDNEAAAVLLGYVYLSTGGIDPFTLAKKLIDVTTPTTTTTPTTLTADDAKVLEEGSVAWAHALASATAVNDDEFADNMEALAGSGSASGSGSTTTTSSNSNAAETLQKLSSIINLSAADFDKLKDTEYSGSSDLFVTNKIIVPKLVSNDLRSSIPVLNYMNRAVLDVCRFVDAGTKSADDDRDSSTACTATTMERKNSAKAHFLWAFSHLTEAMVYQSVLLYTTTSDGVTNFQAAANTLNGTTATNASEISAFVKKVSDLKGAVDVVFDVAHTESMLSTTLRNIIAVKNAFTALSGLPESMTAPITKALSKIEELAKQVSGSDSADASSKTTALKVQMLETVTKKMNTKISAVITKQIENANLPSGTSASSKADIEALKNNAAISGDATKLAAVTAIEKNLYGDPAVEGDEGLCGAYESLSAGVTVDTATQPAACK